MFELSKKEIVKRNFFVYRTAKFISGTGYRLLSRNHVEILPILKKLKKENAVFLYTGLHRSLWETSGVLSCIGFHKLPIPFIGMGDNLVKGKFYVSFASKAGAFLVKRPKSRREVIESSKKLKTYILYFTAHGTDVTIFPEGTRRNIPEKGKYGDFFSTAFEALLEYEKNKEKILAEHKELRAHDTYVVPFNTDYSKIREGRELVKEPGAKPRTLHILDSLKMLKHIGDLYISFGEPIKIADHLDKTRKELAVFAREKCLELVKILPINIVALAILDAHKAGQIKTDKILDNITKNIKKLAHLKERFRGFEPDEAPQDILAKVARYEAAFRKIDAVNLPLYRLYANYIHHYWESGKR